MESNEYVVDEGVSYRVPYQKVMEVTFSNLKKEELVDLEHAARLQYRLLLQDAIIRAEVDFASRKISVTYNPKEATNSKAKIGREEVLELLKKEGVSVSQENLEEKGLDYYKDIYTYQYNPPSVREHQPYGYSPEEWRKMKNDYTRKQAQWEKNNKGKFAEWQSKYLLEHPELAAELKGAKIKSGSDFLRIS